MIPKGRIKTNPEKTVTAIVCRRCNWNGICAIYDLFSTHPTMKTITWEKECPGDDLEDFMRKQGKWSGKSWTGHV